MTAVAALQRLGNVAPRLSEQFVEICNRLTSRAHELEDRADEWEQSDEGGDYEHEAAAPGSDIGAAFADL